MEETLKTVQAIPCPESPSRLTPASPLKNLEKVVSLSENTMVMQPEEDGEPTIDTLTTPLAAQQVRADALTLAAASFGVCCS